MNTLSNLTQQMNNLANKVTNSTERAETEEEINRGTSGLGIINESNSNKSLESPVGFMDKVDSDKRKLATFTDIFTDNSEYVEYISNWFTSTEIFIVTHMDNCLLLQMNDLHNQNFSTNYRLYACLNHNIIDAALQDIGSKDTLIENTIIMGYVNFNDNEIRAAKKYNIQTIGIDGILEINNAIESADNGLPYVSINNSSFLHILASSLHNKYKNFNKLSKQSFNNVADNISESLNNFGNKASIVLNDVTDGICICKTVDKEDNKQLVEDNKQLEYDSIDNVGNDKKERIGVVSLDKNNSDTVCNDSISLRDSTNMSLEN